MYIQGEVVVDLTHKHYASVDEPRLSLCIHFAYRCVCPQGIIYRQAVDLSWAAIAQIEIKKNHLEFVLKVPTATIMLF
ncbi:hypothetical protein JYQ62_01465 [Nostoc sp. UHCC 0702]|nr:hypothetical protein JYQ62_01465 [Nostoc sp. UHCC 0702]